MGTILLCFAALLCSAALYAAGALPVGALLFAWVLGPVAVVGLLLLRDRHDGLRRTGAGLLAACTLGAALAFGIHPALAADALPVPPGDTGLWAAVNPYLADGITAVVGTVATWAFGVFSLHTHVRLRADQEAQLRELMTTGLFWGAHQLELQIDQHWTPEQRERVAGQIMLYVQQRAASKIKRLGLPDFVVHAMAHKVMASTLGLVPGFGEVAQAFEGRILGADGATAGKA